MKVAGLNDSSQGMGGGWTFMRNLEKSLSYFPERVKWVGSIEEADICFISGTSMVTKETVQKVKDLNKKLVVRLDNVPRNSRNRNTGTSRLKGYAEQADAIVWQCDWARRYLMDFIHNKNERVIYNGVDLEIFTPEGIQAVPGERTNRYLYSRFNRDETKNWEVAWFDHQINYREDNSLELFLVGQFSPEQLEYNFDFFRGEKVKYLGVVPTVNEMANVYRSVGHLYAVYYNDCYANTYMEALACGVQLKSVNFSGGTEELINNWARKGREWNGLRRMGEEYLELFESL